MTDLQESWRRIEAHLRRAHELAGGPPLKDFHDYLEHNELELAADVLAEFGDERGDQSLRFWEALTWAYEIMGLGEKAKRCGFRHREAQHGFVEARLTLTATDDGGRSSCVVTGYRPDWDIGGRTESGDAELNGASITLEDAPRIPPGGIGLVRLHPHYPDCLGPWAKVKPGVRITMHEGSRVVGHAEVLRAMVPVQA